MNIIRCRLYFNVLFHRTLQCFNAGNLGSLQDYFQSFYKTQKNILYFKIFFYFFLNLCLTYSLLPDIIDLSKQNLRKEGTDHQTRQLNFQGNNKEREVQTTRHVSAFVFPSNERRRQGSRESLKSISVLFQKDTTI